MATKKIRLDLSKVEDRAGWKTDSMPEGLHEFKIELVDDKDAGDGTEMYTYGLRPTNPKYKTRLFPYYCKQQANQYFKIRDLHIAAGVLDPKRAKGKAVDIVINAPIGKLVAAEVRDSSNPQYAGRSEIDAVYDVSILDDEDGVEPDEDDEEYDEEEADEVEDDEEEVDDDELREEIEGLTLAALRKRAKGLGIDTDGVKKDDLVELVIEEELGEEEDDEDEDDLDDDDLDDDELEDEEFEDDEEEEEEPVKPARKAPASRKAAPAKAAPAKRTVRRR